MTIIYYDITEEGKLVNRKEYLTVTEETIKTFSLTGVWYDKIVEEGLVDKFFFAECRLWGVKEVYVYYDGEENPLKIEVEYD